MKHGFLKIAAILICFFFTNSANAQIGGSIELTPSIENARPGQEVTITARSYSLDIDAANVTWSVNGQVMQKGVGLTTYTLKAPSLGKRSTVSVSAVNLNGAYAEGKFSLNSGYVDLIIETDGYVPPFFKGKTPVVYQNAIKVIAIPHLAKTDGTEYDPKTLVYSWSKNSKAIQESSGYGKQSVTFVGDLIPREFSLNVTVTNREGTLSASSYIPISFSNPSISFYIDDPLYGPLFNKGIASSLRIGSEREVGITGVPFGFSRNTTNNLQFAWSVNGNIQSNLSQKEAIILRAPSGEKGASNIDLSIKNGVALLQSALNSIQVSFEANSSTTNPQF